MQRDGSRSRGRRVPLVRSSTPCYTAAMNSPIDDETDPLPRHHLRVGQPIVFLDRRRRTFYDILAPGRSTNIRGERIAHDDVIGQPDGARCLGTLNRIYRCFAATLVDHALNMRRHANIIYPKDAAPLLMWADINPGDTVIEGGFGSGGMSMALLRAIGSTGRLITYELQQSAANAAAKNVAAFFGAPPPNHTVHIGDIYAGITEREVDRIVLDVPEPWMVIEPAAEALRDGGILASYVPTTLQLQAFALAIRAHPAFATTECMEVMLRTWHVTAESVRPHSQMIGHTGFLAFTRRSARPRPAVDPPAATDEAEPSPAAASEG